MPFIFHVKIMNKRENLAAYCLAPHLEVVMKYRLFILSAVSIVFCSLMLPAAGSAVSVGQADNFEDGTTQNWGVGHFGATPPAPPVNVPTGGPAGESDNYLLLTAIPSDVIDVPGSRLVVINDIQWAGNYPASGVGAITMDLNNLSSTDLFLRILLADPSDPLPPNNIAVSSVPVFVPAGSGWTFGVFPIGPGNLTALKGDVNAALANATEIRIFHNPVAGFPPPPVLVETQLGVDNIAAHPSLLPVCRPQTDTLTVTKAVFRTAESEWIVTGTSLPAPSIGSKRTVMIFLGTPLKGTIVGAAAVRADGTWVLKRSGSPVIPGNLPKISVKSTDGGKLRGVPLVVR